MGFGISIPLFGFESMDEELKGMRNNKINIDFLKEQVSKLQEDVEKLIRNGNGAH